MISDMKKYRLIDLILLSIIALIAEVMANVLLVFYPGAGYFLSFSILVAMIAIIRWGKVGSIVYVIAGLPMIFLGSGTLLENILIYPIANIFIILNSLIFKFLDRDKLKLNNFYLVLYVLVSYLCLSLGKGLGGFVINGSFLRNLYQYLVTHLFNIIMVFIALNLIKGKDGLLVDMSVYINNGE